MTIKSWTDYFIDMAKTCSSRSNCLRAQVGAVIVGQDKKIKATGYNGTPSGVESCYERGECYRIKNNIPSGTCYETCRSIHAEQNAIIPPCELPTVNSEMVASSQNSIEKPSSLDFRERNDISRLLELFLAESIKTESMRLSVLSASIALMTADMEDIPSIRSDSVILLVSFCIAYLRL